MLKKFALSAVFIGFCINLCSCETIQGAANGLGQDIKNTCNNLSGLGQKLKAADEKMREKFW
jgi:predicted small secreted protein